MNVFEAVKENVTARQAAEMYGIRVNRNGMACCPFHDDKHPSMKVDKRFHCFGCQADGDVIDLAARLYGLNNLGAAVKLASDFGIDYDHKGRASPRPVKKKISEELRLKQAELQCCRILSEYNHLLGKWKTEYAPETPGEEWHPLFVEALQKQTYTEYLLDTLLTGTAEEKTAVIKGHGKEVMRIGERISGFAARHKAGRDERSRPAPTGTDGR
ncbi:CHC2 zinc finger domain-containing protein [Parablautia intestinalis]|uniref:CHC2 zinc finger domain-containing protein n=1 Tax=Parablautia intestinalis TaxID=2320100 RepID=UPI00256F0240|nr:CHC2 zinc finger domain-containing protein [Parablautia intestinalis]